MPTSAELVKWWDQGCTRLAAGAGGLGRDIARAVAWSPKRPGTVLHDGDVVIADRAEWRPVEDFRASRFVEMAAGIGVAGIVMIGQFDGGAERVAADCDIPLLILPPGESALGVERTLCTWLAQRKDADERLGTDLLEQLTDLVHVGAGIPVLLGYLAQVTRKVAVLHELGGTIQHLGQRAEHELSEAKVRRVLSRATGGRRHGGDTYHAVTELGLASLTSSVPGGHLGAPCVSLIGAPAAFAYRDYAALRALTLARTSSEPGTAADESLDAVLLSMLMFGDDASFQAEAAARRHDVTLPHAAFAIRLAPGADREAIRAALDPFDATFRCSGDSVAGLVAGRPLAEQRERTRLMERLSGVPGVVRIGFSAAHAGPVGMRQGVVEALRALRDAELAGAEQASAYARTRVQRLLQGALDDAVLADLRERVLEPLLHYDQFEPPGLLPTLEAYLDNACVTLRTAEMLNCHRNSVVYRLQRIREIADVDLDDPDTRLLLHLALRSLRMTQPNACVRQQRHCTYNLD